MGRSSSNGLSKLVALVRKDLKLLTRRPYDISVFLGVLMAYGVLGGRVVEPKLASLLGALTLAVIASLLLVHREEERGLLSGLRLYIGYDVVFLAKLLVMTALVFPLAAAIYLMSTAFSNYAEMDLAPLFYSSVAVVIITLMASVVALYSNISSVLLIGISTSLATPILLDVLTFWQVDLSKAIVLSALLILGLLTVYTLD